VISPSYGAENAIRDQRDDRDDGPNQDQSRIDPSSTIVQASPVHTGLTDDPALTLDYLFATLVRGRR
jgi:hypothetical protein